MSVRIVVALLVTGACLALAVPLQAAGEKDRIAYLFAQTADKAEIAASSEGTWTLRLRGVDLDTIWFTDRPARDVGRISKEKFIENWNTGADSFNEDPPNAVIELRDASGKTLLVTVTLISMTQDGGDLIYRIRPLDVKDLGLALQGRAGKALNEIPVGEFLSPVLFIDYVIGIL